METGKIGNEMNRGRILFSVLALSLSIFVAESQHHTIYIKSTDSGKVYEGIGAVSAGASSRLLIDYEEPYRSDILDYLFKPQFGACLQHFKFEMGGDMNSTCGTEPSHARTRKEMLHPKKQYFQRSYELWMAQEAKKRNPGMIFDVLQWGAPGWLEGGFYSQDNADYVRSFIQGAKKYAGINITYCGLWNEKHIPDLSRNYVVNHLRPTLDRAGLQQVKIIGNDMYCSSPAHHQPWSYVDELLADNDLSKAIGVLGYHYLQVDAPAQAEKLGIPVWESEASILNGDWKNALSFAREVIKNYVNSRVVKTIIWNPIDAYFPNVSWNHVGAMQAKHPWCGYYEVRPAIWAIAHFTQFVQPGWRFVDNACGRTTRGVQYITLKDPDSNHYSIIVTGGDQSDTIKVNFEKTPGEIYCWESNEKKQFVKSNQVKSKNDGFEFVIAPGYIYSFTSTTGQMKGLSSHPVPGKKDFPTQYSENFNEYVNHQKPRYFSDQGGAFEVVKTFPGGGVLQQQITESLICWDPWGPNNPEPFTQIGTLMPGNCEVSVEVNLPVNGLAKLYGRVRWFESNTGPHGIGLTLDASGNWHCIFDQQSLRSGVVPVKEWNVLKLVFVDRTVTGWCNDIVLFEEKVPEKFTSGYCGIGSNRTYTRFDNFKLMTRGKSND
ncbi:MAG: hypothetical protein VB102_13250 [Paludibacter sp.]|nr:hypothetical protein [Paludibacter sp.]